MLENESQIFIDIREKEENENNRIYVYKILKENIINLKLKPGEKISEVQIQNFFKVSRSPIREAIVRLNDESLVDVFPQKGTYVSLLDNSLIEDSLFVRSAIEKEIMKTICSSDFDSSNLLDELEYIILEQKKIESKNMEEYAIKKFFLLNEQFHKAIYKYLNKEKIWEKMRYFETHYIRFHILESLSKTNVDFAINQHIDIIKSIKDKNYDMALKIENNLLDNYKVKLKKVYDLYPFYFKNKIF